MAVLLVSFDTLRADVAYSGKFPTIDRILRRGTTFQTAISSSPLTPPSHASVLSGLHPPRHGLRHLFKEPINEDVTMVAEYLQRSGWRTGAITSCPGLNRWYGFDRGFSHFDDEIPLLSDGTDPLLTIDVKLRGTALKRANIVADRAIEWVAQEPDSDFFLFIHFFDAHWPYEAPEQVGIAAANRYEEEVAFMDHHLGRFLNWLEAHGYLDEMMILFFSDHGEDLGGWYPNDHAGARGHPEEEGHGALLFDTTQLVGLSVSWPGHIPAGRRFENQVRLVDITPTILDLAGFPEPDGLDGRSLRPIWEGRERDHRPAYFETFYREELARTRPEFSTARPLAGVRLDDKWKVLWEPCGADADCKVFDLIADPGEWRPQLEIVRNSAVPPRFAAATPDAAAIEGVLAAAHAAGLEVAPLERLLKHLLAREELGIVVRGSLFDGQGDEWSDVDLELRWPDRAPGPDDHAWLREQIEKVGTILAWFPATHLSMPNLLIFFVDYDGEVIKVDAHCVGPGEPRSDKSGWNVRAPSGAMPTVRRDTPPVLDLGLSSQRLAGWTWYCQTKICRGELFEAFDGLNTIRNEIIIPALRSVRNLPPEGSRRLERLPLADREALLKTVARDVGRATLQQALESSAKFAMSLLERVAEQRGEALDLGGARILLRRAKEAADRVQSDAIA